MTKGGRSRVITRVTAVRGVVLLRMTEWGAGSSFGLEMRPAFHARHDRGGLVRPVFLGTR